MLWKIDGYLVIPHELLHVLAYRLIGKKCHYRLGDHFVRSLEPHSWRSKLFVLLFPLLVTGGTALVLMALWFALYVWIRFPVNPIEYFQVAPFWHQALWFASVFLLLYSGSAIYDIVFACRLLMQKLRQQPPDHPQQQQDERKGP